MLQLIFVIILVDSFCPITKFANGQIDPTKDVSADFMPTGTNAPYHLSLQHQNFIHFCSGVLSVFPNENAVWPRPTPPDKTKQRQFGLTTAACVRHMIRPILAVAGQIDNKDRAGAQIRVVTEVHSHSNFSRTTMENNLAVLVFEWDFKIVDSPHPHAVWPISYDFQYNGTASSNNTIPNPYTDAIFITGYGFMFPRVTEATKHKLQVVRTHVMYPSASSVGPCHEKYLYDVGNKKYTYFNSSYNRCYKNTKGMGTERCYGDDGAVVVNCNVHGGLCDKASQASTHFVIGIVNHGHDCFHKIDAAFFTPVFCYSGSYKFKSSGALKKISFLNWALNNNQTLKPAEILFREDRECINW